MVLMDGTTVEFECYMYVREIGREKPCNSYTFRVAGVDVVLKRYVTPQLETVDVKVWVNRTLGAMA
jgi:hypothetical protein